MRNPNIDSAALKAAETLENQGTDAEVIDLRTLNPLDIATVIESVKKTARAVVVYEGWLTGGAGAEVASQIYEAAFDDLDAPVRRVTGENAPMPYARNLELLKTPSKAKIAAAIREVCYA